MKGFRFLTFILVLLLVFDFILIFIDDGNKLENVSFDATVTSCKLNENTGLDTYYIVEYTYTKDDTEITGKDSFYTKEVEVGETIVVTERVTVVSEYSKYIFYALILCNILVGIVGFFIVLKFIKTKCLVKDTKNKSKQD